jgi:enoyl-CoA hydratase
LIERCKVPVIAAVNGFALGGGCELAMACHIRIAGEKARFGQPEVNLGIIPGYGGTQRLSQIVGKGKSLELNMTADIIDAQEAYRIGLANQVVPAGEEVIAAVKMLEKIGSKGPVAISKVIEAVNAYYAPGVDGFAAEIAAFGETTNTEDFREGATAFIEKRGAEFKGR